MYLAHEEQLLSIFNGTIAKSEIAIAPGTARPEYIVDEIYYAGAKF